MGHTIVGELPKTRRWQQVFDLLQEQSTNPSMVASATVRAAEKRLNQLRGDESLTYCFWLLTRLAAAARGPDFQSDARQLGIEVRRDDHVLSLIAKVNDRAREELVQFPESGPFGDLAASALRSSLTDTLGAQNLSLFASSVDDLAGAFRRHSTASQFGELATWFFGTFYAETLRYYVDRALPASLSADGGLRTLADMQLFRDALDKHARESARIVELFAAQWWVKHKGPSGEPISRDEARGFAAHALTKLRKELEAGVQ
jgi:hypothetical protein